ncbi:MAG: hypothetical protein ACYC4S_04465 [Rhodoferax sp.]
MRFESAEIGHTIGKTAFHEAVTLLRAALLEAQVDLYADKKIPVLLLISGQDGAGKGETINVLYEWMDPRFLATAAKPLLDLPVWGFGPFAFRETEFISQNFDPCVMPG